jgi:RNA polymerase sigma factor (sigma-70 family)
MSKEDHLNTWDSFKKGDWSAYTALYEQHYKLLNNYGYKFTRDTSLIEDAIHDLFIKLWTNKRTLGDPPSVKNYLYKSLRSILFRKMQVQSRFVDLQDEDYAFNVEISHDNQLILNEEELSLQTNIKEVLDKLPGRQQEIVYLRFFEGLSYEEIADIMSIHINSTYKLLYKALDNLQKDIKFID